MSHSCKWLLASLLTGPWTGFLSLVQSPQRKSAVVPIASCNKRFLAEYAPTTCLLQAHCCEANEKPNGSVLQRLPPNHEIRLMAP